MSGPRADSPLALENSHPPVGHLGPGELHANHRPVLDDQAARRAQLLELEQVLAHRFVENFRARAAQRFLALERRVGRDVTQRHVEHAATIVELARRDAEVRILQIVRGEYRLEPLALEAQHVFLDSARGQRRHRGFDLQNLDHVDRGQPAPDHDHARCQRKARSVVGRLEVMIEPVDERVLVDQPAIDELVGALDRERPVAPRAMRQHQAVEPPRFAQLVELDIAAHPSQRHVLDIRMVQALVDLLVLFLALLDVPAREAVFDLAVGPRVLLEDHDYRAALGQDARDFRSGGRGAEHRHHVTRLCRVAVSHRGTI